MTVQFAMTAAPAVRRSLFWGFGFLGQHFHADGDDALVTATYLGANSTAQHGTLTAAKCHPGESDDDGHFKRTDQCSLQPQLHRAATGGGSGKPATFRVGDL